MKPGDRIVWNRPVKTRAGYERQRLRGVVQKIGTGGARVELAGGVTRHARFEDLEPDSAWGVCRICRVAVLKERLAAQNGCCFRHQYSTGAFDGEGCSECLAESGHYPDCILVDP